MKDPILVYQTDANGILMRTAVVHAEWNEDFGRFLYPAGTRTKQPPALGEHQAARTLGPELDADWEVIPDYVGYRYWMSDRSEHVITEYGVTPPVGHLTADPGPTLQQQAGQELSATQAIVMACYEAGIPFPADWRAYRVALRAIAAGTSAAVTMPIRPADPEGL